MQSVESRFIPTDEKFLFKGIQWDPNTNTSSTFVLPKVSEDFQFSCGIDNGELLGVAVDKPPGNWRYKLAVTDQGHLQELKQPDFPSMWLLEANVNIRGHAED